MRPYPSRTATCRCGAVAFEAEGKPIMSVGCHCDSCREAGRALERVSGGRPVLDANGGTEFLLYRKDRIRCARGGEQLQAHRLKPEASTRRLVTQCCHTAMFLEFKGGHWVSLYRDRMPDAPPLEMRVMTSNQPEGVGLPSNLPNHANHSGAFMWKLLSAWVAMGFRAPKVQGVPS